eukprot:scaffold4311_cov124-Isochrysis_galbana.AAC.2
MHPVHPAPISSAAAASTSCPVFMHTASATAAESMSRAALPSSSAAPPPPSQVPTSTAAAASSKDWPALQRKAPAAEKAAGFSSCRWFSPSTAAALTRCSPHEANEAAAAASGEGRRFMPGMVNIPARAGAAPTASSTTPILLSLAWFGHLLRAEGAPRGDEGLESAEGRNRKESGQSDPLEVETARACCRVPEIEDNVGLGAAVHGIGGDPDLEQAMTQGHNDMKFGGT